MNTILRKMQEMGDKSGMTIRSFCRLFTVVVFSCILAACSSNKDKAAIGVYCGECKGKCFGGYIMEGDSIRRFSEKYITDVDIDQVKGVGVSGEEYERARDLFDLIPENYNQLQERIGEPDAHDQCGVYLFVRKDSRVKQIYIDPDDDKHPDELDSLVQEATSIL